MASISSQAQSAAESVAELTKQLQDLSLTYENIAKNVDDTFLEKLNTAYSSQIGFVGKLKAVNMILKDSLTKINEQEERQLANRKKAKQYVEREKKHLEYLVKKGLLNKTDLEYLKREQRLKEIEKKADNKDEWAKHEKFLKIRNSLQVAGLTTLKLIAVGYGVLQSAIVGVVSWENKLQVALSKVSRTIGSTSKNVVEIRNAAKDSFLDPGSLGGLGFGLEEITSQLTEFADKMEWTNKVISQEATALIKLGVGLGMTSNEVGDLTRSIVVMGGSAKDTENFMTDMMTSARIAGVNAKTMAKAFTGAGKALFEITGPKARQRLLESAGYFAKMGMSLDKMKGFVDMTDSFDQAATSMAKLNTAFGTHINALEVFAEQDADKRVALIAKQLQMQGVNTNMSRQEKKLMAESLNIEQDQLNALLAQVEAGTDFTQALQNQKDLEKSRAKTQVMFEESLWKAKDSLISIGQVVGRIWEGITALLSPLFKGFKFAMGIQSSASFLEESMKKVTAMTETWMKALSGNKFGAIGDNLFQIGKAFGKIFDAIIDFFSSDSFLYFISGIVDMMTVVADIVGFILPPIQIVAHAVAWVVGLAMKLIAWLMPAIKFVAVIAGVIWAIFGGVAAVIAGIIAFFNPITVFVLAIVGIVVGLLALIRKVGDWLGLTGPNKTEQAAQDVAVGEQSAAVSKLGKGDSGAPSIATPEIVAPGRASGGPVTSDSPYMVGENGPELFVPESSGHITPNKVLASSGYQGGGDANITVQVLLDGEVIQERMYKRNLRSIT